MPTPRKVLNAFPALEVSRITGLSVAMIDYLSRSNLLRPSYGDTSGGRGKVRYYSYRDVVIARLIQRLREGGVKLGVEFRSPRGDLVPGPFAAADGQQFVAVFADIDAQLNNKTTLLSGHSGVGKSTLINALVPDLDLKTAEISQFSDKGVHTTTFAEMLEVRPGTFLIDTPGIKELGLVDMKPGELAHFFPEMRALLNQCRYHNCQHLHEPGCAVREAVDKGRIALPRYDSYVSMQQADDNRK